MNFFKWLFSLFFKVKAEPFPELPDTDVKEVIKLCIIVGHESRAGGAAFVGEGYRDEYHYNSEVAKVIKEYGSRTSVDASIIPRDGIGIEGAYAKALALKPDAVIELHFNAYNGKVTGSETLCTPDATDKAFAAIVQKRICGVFKREGMSRGVKPISRSTRGGRNVFAGQGVANCLVEPFFGDVDSECQLAIKYKTSYAEALVNAVREWFEA